MGKEKSVKENCEEQYHARQFETPYRSTIAFVEWLGKYVDFSKGKINNILDLACGAGANLVYLRDMYPTIHYTGFDIDMKLIEMGNKILNLKGYDNCILEYGDWYNPNMNYKNTFDGIISLQTLSWLPEYKTAIEKMLAYNPKWIALSSLFYEGKINYTIKLEDYTRPNEEQDFSEYYYNIYSLPLVKSLFAEYGYTNFQFHPFNIDIDIEKPKVDGGGLGTYTIKTAEGKNLQVSGGLMLPWYFIYASK